MKPAGMDHVLMTLDKGCTFGPASLSRLGLRLLRGKPSPAQILSMDAPISDRLFSGSIRYFLAAGAMTSRVCGPRLPSVFEISLGVGVVWPP
jgi:hypothetical protein